MPYASNEHILINTNLVLRINMYAFNPLASIMSNNRLDGTNYVSWKRNLNIVLTCESIIWVTLEPLHVEPTKSSTSEERADYEAWRKDDEKARMYILAYLNEVLQSQHQSMSTSSVILLSLQEIFGVHSRSAKEMVIKQIMNTRMSKGTSMRDHMIKMIRLFNELGDLSADIDWETQNNIVLETLPPSFNHFELNYSMDKLEWSLTELMQQLQIVETIVKGHPNVNFVSDESSKPPNGKKRNKENQYGVHAKPKISKKARPFDPNRKPKEKCFKYEQKGHGKKDCPKLKGQSSNFSTSVIESCFVADSAKNWWIDSGATDHICNSL